MEEMSERNNSKVIASLSINNKKFNLRPGIYKIGRDTEKFKHEIPINHKSVDVKHAVLNVDMFSANIRDLFSENGTFIDGEKINYIPERNLSDVVSIKIGDIIGEFHIMGNEDFLGFDTTEENNSFDVIPSSQQQPTIASQKQNHMLRLSKRNVPSSHIPSSSSSSSLRFNINPEEKRTSTPQSLFIIPSTQNMSKERSTILRNPEKMEEEDDFYVPESQEIFEKLSTTQTVEADNEKNDYIRLCTQDFEGSSGDKSNDSDNILQNFSILTPHIHHSSVLKEETDDNEINTKSTSVMHDNNDDDTDAEEEIFALNWSDSRCFSDVASKRKSTDQNIISVHDLKKVEEGDPNIAGDIGGQQLGQRSGSVTPELDFIIRTEKSEESTDVGETDIGFAETQKFILENSLNSVNIIRTEKSGESTEVGETDIGFAETQKFILENSLNSVNTSSNQHKINSINKSPSNKENTEPPNLEETQIFVLEESQDRNKKKSEINSFKDNSDDSVFLEPNQTLSSKLILSLRKDLKQSGESKELRSNKGVANDDDDDDDMLGPTQPFIFKPPEQKKIQIIESSSFMFSESQDSDSEYCLRPTLEIGEKIEINTKERESDKDTTTAKKDKKNANKRRKSTTTDLINNRTDEGNSISEDSRNSRQRGRRPTTNRLHSNQSPELFHEKNDEDIGISQTPKVDFLVLPKSHDINEADKLFQKSIKDTKRNKLLLEEEDSTNDDSDDDDVDFMRCYEKNSDVEKRQQPTNNTSVEKEKQIFVKLKMKSVDQKKEVIGPRKRPYNEKDQSSSDDVETAKAIPSTSKNADMLNEKSSSKSENNSKIDPNSSHIGNDKSDSYKKMWKTNKIIPLKIDSTDNGLLKQTEQSKRSRRMSIFIEPEYNQNDHKEQQHRSPGKTALNNNRDTEQPRRSSRRSKSSEPESDQNNYKDQKYRSPGKPASKNENATEQPKRSRRRSKTEEVTGTKKRPYKERDQSSSSARKYKNPKIDNVDTVKAISSTSEDADLSYKKSLSKSENNSKIDPKSSYIGNEKSDSYKKMWKTNKIIPLKIDSTDVLLKQTEQPKRSRRMSIFFESEYNQNDHKEQQHRSPGKPASKNEAATEQSKRSRRKSKSSEPESDQKYRSPGKPASKTVCFAEQSKRSRRKSKSSEPESNQNDRKDQNHRSPGKTASNNEGDSSNSVQPSRRVSRRSTISSYLAENYYFDNVFLPKTSSRTGKQVILYSGSESSVSNNESAVNTVKEGRKKSTKDAGKNKKDDNVKSRTRAKSISEEPVIRKSARLAKPRIAFTRVDDSSYKSTIKKIGKR